MEFTRVTNNSFLHAFPQYLSRAAAIFVTMFKILLLSTIIIINSYCFSTPYLADIRNVLTIRNVLRMKNESSVDMNSQVNLMFIHLKTALPHGNLTEIRRFFEFENDMEFLLHPLGSLRWAVQSGRRSFLERISFSVANCHDTHFFHVNTTTCDVTIRYPWRLEHRKQRKSIEVVKRKRAIHDLYSNGYVILSIGREMREKWAGRMNDFYNDGVRRPWRDEDLKDGEVVEEEEQEEEQEEKEEEEEEEHGHPFLHFDDFNR